MNLVKSLRLCASILINDYGYQRVEVSHLQDEVWLSHQNQKDYNLIRLYLGDKPRLKAEHTNQILDAIKSVFHQKLNFLELEFTEDASGVIESDYGLVIQVSALNLPEAFTKQFPKCAYIFKDMDDKSYDKATSILNRRQNAQTPQNFFGFVKNLPKGTLYTSIALIIISLAINAVALIFDYDIYAAAIFFGAYYKIFISAHFEIFRFLTYGFIHTDIFHLLMNVYALINLGNFMERIYGVKKFLITLIAGIIMGSLFVFISQGNVLLVGISAGLYAILGVLGVYLYETGLIKQAQIQAQLWRMVMINIFINFIPQVSVIGHVGGLIAGLFLGFAFSKSAKISHLKLHSMIALALLYISCAVLSFQYNDAKEIYAKTDTFVLEIANDFNLSWYAEDLSDSLLKYYLEVSQ